MLDIIRMHTPLDSTASPLIHTHYTTVF